MDKAVGRLQAKRAIVTGAASGFGAGIAQKFLIEGASVIVADIDEAAAKQTADELRARYCHAKNQQVIPCAVDVASGDGMAMLKSTLEATLGGVDIFVNNAGVTHLPNELDAITEADFDHVLRVNTKSVFWMAHHFIPLMKAQGHGVVLNVASTAGVSPRPRLSWYNASKGWMITATKAMAVELAPLGIRVNAINPVAGETPLLKSFMGEDTPEIRAKFLSTIPLGRFSTPEDMGNAACYLCSAEASMVTGVAMEVDGGRCI